MASTAERSATRIRGFKNPGMDFQVLRYLGATEYGGASPKERGHEASGPRERREDHRTRSVFDRVTVDGCIAAL